MPTDTAPIRLTAAVITSGAEAIRTAREFAASIADGVIERDRSGAVPARELAALDASHDPVAWKYHHIGNFLLKDVLPPNHGQI